MLDPSSYVHKELLSSDILASLLSLHIQRPSVFYPLKFIEILPVLLLIVFKNT